MSKTNVKILSILELFTKSRKYIFLRFIYSFEREKERAQASGEADSLLSRETDLGEEGSQDLEIVT